MSGPKRACLYANVTPGGDMLAAETTYTVPEPPPLQPSTPAIDYDCSDFAFRENAQPYLLPGNPHGLDADGDGVACDDLPSSAAPVIPTLRLGEAHAAARKHLRRRYGSYRRGNARTAICVRTGRLQARCAVRWRYNGRRYRGTVKVKAISADTLRLQSKIRRSGVASTASTGDQALTLWGR
jgi:hypothetical protein